VSRARPRFNARFAVPAREKGSAFVPWTEGSLDDILCEQFERTISHRVRFEKLSLQISADQHRCHRVKVEVKVHRYPRSSMGRASWQVKLHAPPEGRVRQKLSFGLEGPQRRQAVPGFPKPTPNTGVWGKT
jgi:hypothetical protein